MEDGFEFMKKFSADRRDFLQKASTLGLASCSANLFQNHWIGKSLFAQNGASANSSAVARVYVDTRRTISPIDRNLFGSFLEHLGRAIYEGI